MGCLFPRKLATAGCSVFFCRKSCESLTPRKKLLMDYLTANGDLTKATGEPTGSVTLTYEDLWSFRFCLLLQRSTVQVQMTAMLV